MKLTIELVPETAFFKNLRSEFSETQWDFIRKKVYRRAGYRCEVCGGKGDKWPVEAHEEWTYHPDGRQELRRIAALCPMCHKCKHPGLANMRGELPLVIEHLAHVNGISEAAAEKMIDEAFRVWKQRSTRKWTLDFSKTRQWLERQGIE